MHDPLVLRGRDKHLLVAVVSSNLSPAASRDWGISLQQPSVPGMRRGPDRQHILFLMYYLAATKPLLSSWYKRDSSEGNAAAKCYALAYSSTTTAEYLWILHVIRPRV